MTRVTASEAAAELARLRAAGMNGLAAEIAGRLECPEHGNTLLRDSARAACCVKGCAYEVAL
jgi:hypothetical protein